MSIEDFISWANQQNELHVVRVARAYQTEQERDLFKNENVRLKSKLNAEKPWGTVGKISTALGLILIIVYLFSALFYRLDPQYGREAFSNPHRYTSLEQNALRINNMATVDTNPQ